ncbi:MAG: High-affinity nickel-transporter [Chloroflexi bacterium]|nr:High-affinity nickel-transporter [Chloroflexota bacterium]
MGGILAFVLIPIGVAQAHPLGNFTVNHYDGLQLYPDRIDVLSIVDIAEIPTAQDLQALAPDGTPTDQQLEDAAAVQCSELSREVTAAVDGQPLVWTIQSSTLETRPGAAGLPTLRLTCQLRAAADLTLPRTVDFADNYRADRVGWHEITANGSGVRLVDPPVGATSTSDELRTYPTDLLTSPLDQRGVQLRTEPGTNVASDLRVSSSSGDPFSSFIASMDRFLQDLIGGELTLWVGTLAVLLAVLLGSAHALLPGHGKTMIAAYLAARSGRRGDAFIVAGTVTATHTAGVLLLGVAISVSSSLAGEQVLRWLGIVSGLLVAGIGVFMLRTALRNRQARRQRRSELSRADQAPALVSSSASAGQSQLVEHEQDHTRDSIHDPEHDASPDSAQRHHDHGPHGHGHGHGHGAHDHATAEAQHDHELAHSHAHSESWWEGGHSHEPAVGRGGLIGMGVAGGLVPSPSALIVLVASIALGRTVFGVFLVVAYGLGMAGTLSVAGLILVRLRGRLEQRAARAGRTGGRSRLAAIAAALPILTAALVLIVGLGLALRGLLLTG